jgi:hypothetical protein
MAVTSTAKTAGLRFLIVGSWDGLAPKAHNPSTEPTASHVAL